MKNKVETESYTLIWQAACLEMRNEVTSFLEEKNQHLQKQLKVKFTHEEKGTDQLIIRLMGADGINGHKLLQQLIRQLTKGLSHLNEALDDEHWMLITPPKKPSEGGRLEKLLRSITETFYVDVNHIYGPEPQILRARFNNRKISILDHDDKVFLIDEVGLRQKINLNCEACTRNHTFGCCTGSPCNYSNKNLKTYKVHEKAIIEEMKRIEPTYYEAVRKKRLEEGNSEINLVDFDGTVGECEGRCMLLVREDGIAKCLAHKYALDHQLPIYTISPLSCLLFPLEVIACTTDKGKRLILLTSVVEDEIATTIGRWGSYKDLGITLSCINESLCNDSFKKQHYKTVLEENKGLLTYEFGESLYEGLVFTLLGF